MTFVKKMILLLLINQAEMNIIHKYKCNFSVLKDQRANILHGVFQIFYHDTEQFILSTC